jgi:fluoroquinolone transport system permease protein
MNRFLSTAQVDLEVQLRNGLYLATGLVLLVTVGALSALSSTGIARLLPAVALQTMGVTAFFFSAALVLLERSEGSSLARSVTPLRAGEYLGARVATLGALALVQHLVMGVVLLGPAPQLVALIGGVLLASAILTLAGFALAAGKESLGALLLPAIPWLGALLAPMLADVLEWQSPLLWLHPLYGPLVLMRAAVAPVATWEIYLALVTGLIWVGAASILARRFYNKVTR